MDNTADTVVSEKRHREGGKYLSDTLRNLKNFDSDLNQTIFDSVLKNLYSLAETKVTVCREFNTGGDSYYSYKIVENAKAQLKLYLFKYDCGEYGFGHDQYLFDNDSLALYRQFYYGVGWETDTSKEWRLVMNEEIYQFGQDPAVIKKREKVPKSDQSGFLDDVQFRISFIDKSAALLEKSKDFKRLINLEKEKVEED